jgi:predicted nuclease with TOPRIM domain
MDQELIAYLDERFQKMDARFEQVDGRFERVDGRFEQVHDEIRQTRVEVEGLRGDLRLLAEGVMGMNEKLDRFQADVAQRFEEVHGFIKILPYSSLERRVHTLETWRETKERDPIDIIRERLQNGTI